MANEIPVIGAALSAANLIKYKDWIVADQRDLEIQDPCYPGMLDSDWSDLSSSIKNSLQGYSGRLGVHAPFIGYSLSAGFDPLLADAVRTRLYQTLDFCSEIGATHMVIHSPFKSFGSSPFAISLKRGAFLDDYTCSRALLDPLVEKASKQNCKIMIENIQDTNPAQLLQLISSYDSEYVRLSIDVGHCMITHKLGGPSPDQWVTDGGDFLEHLHIQDSDGLTDRHWTPGEGNINWFAFFSALSKIDNTPRMHLELRNHDAIIQGAEYLSSRGFVR